MFTRLPDAKDLAFAIAENSAQGIVVMDEAGHCLYANRAWTELTGFTAEDMKSKPVHDWVHHHHPDGMPFPLEECPIGCTLGKNEKVRNRRELFFRKDGTSFHVSCAASPILVDGVPILKILEIRDVAEDVEFDRRRDELLAMLAHELRNPLAPIAAAAELLKMGRLDETGMKQASAVISRQVEHMTGLTNDLVDVSRVTRGLIELHKESLDIKVIVEEAIEQVRPLINARCHSADVNAPREPAVVFGDRKRLVQVFANILGNAAKYTPDGGKITVSIETCADSVQVSIADNGIGMTSEMADRAFELFAQAQRSSDRAQGGLGVGLTLVRSLVSLHGGRVSANSAGIGKGAVLKVHFPKQHQHSLGKTDGCGNEAVPAVSRPLKIMVVDDSRDAAEMLGMLLMTLGHRVRVECDPRKALEGASIDPQDVFLLDVGLPVMDGMELARRIRQQPKNAKALLIAITGYGQERDRRTAMDAGFNHHLVKPVSLERLSALLNDAARVPTPV